MDFLWKLFEIEIFDHTALLNALVLRFVLMRHPLCGRNKAMNFYYTCDLSGKKSVILIIKSHLCRQFEKSLRMKRVRSAEFGEGCPYSGQRFLYS